MIAEYDQKRQGESYPKSLRVRLWITRSGTRGTSGKDDFNVDGCFLTGSYRNQIKIKIHIDFTGMSGE